MRTLLVTLLFASRLAACSDDCTHSTGLEIRSPNGYWTAQSHSSLCGGKILALGSEETFVTLTRHRPKYPDISKIVFSAAIEPSDVLVSWTSDFDLELRVPTRTFPNLLVASYDVISISLKTPDPEEHDRWIKDKRSEF